MTAPPIHPGTLAALLLGGVVLVQLIVIAGVVRAWKADIGRYEKDGNGNGEGRG